MTTLDDRLDADYAPAWRPNPGEKVIGTVTALDVREGTYGAYPIVTLDTGNSEVAVHCFHEVLANELAKIAPKIGDRVGIKDVGKHPERGYHVYKVRRDGGGDEFAWNRFGGDTGEAMSDLPDDFRAADTGYGNPPVKPAGGGDAGEDEIPFRWRQPPTRGTVYSRFAGT